MIEMVKLDDGTYVPRECCTVTNPITSGGKSEVDDIDMPCGTDCDGECSNCVVQKIMNEYAVLTGQAANNGLDGDWRKNNNGKKITVICDDDVDVISITTRSNKLEGNSWVIGIFDVQSENEVRMPDIKPENRIDNITV